MRTRTETSSREILYNVSRISNKPGNPLRNANFLRLQVEQVDSVVERLRLPWSETREKGRDNDKAISQLPCYRGRTNNAGITMRVDEGPAARKTAREEIQSSETGRRERPTEVRRSYGG